MLDPRFDVSESELLKWMAQVAMLSSMHLPA